MARKATAPADKKAPGAVGATADDVDKIRNIIFGEQMREYSVRFEEMEREIESTVDRLAKQLEKRFDKLEKTVHARMEQLKDNLKQEAARRQDEDTAAKKELSELGKLLEQTANESREQLAANVAELEAALASQDQALGKLVAKTRAEVTKALSTETTRLQRDKVTAKDLAQLFSEMSQNLKRNSK